MPKKPTIASLEAAMLQMEAGIKELEKDKHALMTKLRFLYREITGKDESHIEVSEIVQTFALMKAISSFLENENNFLHDKLERVENNLWYLVRLAMNDKSLDLIDATGAELRPGEQKDFDTLQVKRPFRRSSRFDHLNN